MVKFLESSTIGKNNGVIPSHGGKAGAFVGWVPPNDASGVVACGPSGVCDCQGKLRLFHFYTLYTLYTPFLAVYAHLCTPVIHDIYTI